MRLHTYVACLLIVVPFSDPLTAQPPARHLEEIGYDPSRKTLIVYGGSEPAGNSWVEPTNLWEWDGKSWKVTHADGPGSRRVPVIVYDREAQKTLVIGGVAGSKDSILFDTWSWDGRSWELLNTACPMKEPRGVYDPVGRSVLAYGEVSSKTVISYGEERVFELWEYKQGTWNKLADEGPDDRPAQLTYDTDRKVLVVPYFADSGVEVWEWSDAGWTKKPCQGDCPSSRTRFSIAYDPQEKASFLFGGLSEAREQLGDFWKWDGTKWLQLPTGDQPKRRNSAHLVYGDGELLLYGGSVPDDESGKLVLSNELWSWKNSKWIKR